MAKELWHKLDRDTYNRVWDQFEEQFSFRPSVNPKRLPGITEPLGSYTVSLESATADINTDGAADCHSLRQWLWSGIRKAGLAEEDWYVLDWQHDCYSITPNQIEGGDATCDWPVPVFPDGDYSIFATTDFRVGYFGHPWEPSACVWGNPLVAAIPSSSFLYPTRVLRRN
jgi:hypothetical protein